MCHPEDSDPSCLLPGPSRDLRWASVQRRHSRFFLTHASRFLRTAIRIKSAVVEASSLYSWIATAHLCTLLRDLNRWIHSLQPWSWLGGPPGRSGRTHSLRLRVGNPPVGRNTFRAVVSKVGKEDRALGCTDPESRAHCWTRSRLPWPSTASPSASPTQ